MATFSAAYNGGPCPNCDVRIAESDEVTYDGTNHLIHAVCPSLIVDIVGPICEHCGLEIPRSGVCGWC